MLINEKTFSYLALGLLSVGLAAEEPITLRWNAEIVADSCAAIPPSTCDGVVGQTMGELSVTVTHRFFNTGPRQGETDYIYELESRANWDNMNTLTIPTTATTCGNLSALGVTDRPLGFLEPVVTKAYGSLVCISVGSPLGAISLGWDVTPVTDKHLDRLEIVSSCAPGYFVSRIGGSPDDPLTVFASGAATVIAPLCDHTGTDTDADGRPDDQDNCLNVANGETTPDAGGFIQRDTDGDGFGNICDPDLDNSGLVDTADQTLLQEAFGTQDVNADFDGDGFVNYGDLAIFSAMLGLPPGPSGVN